MATLRISGNPPTIEALEVNPGEKISWESDVGFGLRFKQDPPDGSSKKVWEAATNGGPKYRVEMNAKKRGTGGEERFEYDIVAAGVVGPDPAIIIK